MKSLRIVAASAAVVLAGCGIGEGVTLNRVSIVPVSNTTTTETVPTTKVFRCIRDQLQAYGTFTNGGVGIYTSRGRWTSSNENILKISNGDRVLDAVPGTEDQVFVPGTMTAISPGTVTVTFDYVGLQETIEVTVEDLDDSAISIQPDDPILAPGSLQGLRVIAEVEGRNADITSSAKWSFTQPDDTIATISSANGVVTAKTKTGGTLTAKAEFTACTATPTTTVTVKPIFRLDLQREFTPAPTELIVGTSELLRVIARFDENGNGTVDEDEKSQDLSSQTSFAVTPSGFIAFALSQGLTSEMLALTPGGPVGVVGVFDPEGYDPVEAVDPNTGLPGLTLSTVTATLNSVKVEPKTATIAPLEFQQFRAIGTYDNGARTQEITRHVLWTSSDPTIAVVNNLATISGLAAAVKAEPTATESVTITAVGTSATAQVTDDNKATLTVAPESP